MVNPLNYQTWKLKWQTAKHKIYYRVNFQRMPNLSFNFIDVSKLKLGILWKFTIGILCDYPDCKFPKNAQLKFRNIDEVVTFFLKFAIGIIAKDPVTSSKFRSKIMTNPVGKIIAPTISSPVCTEAVKANVVANPKKAPDNIDLINISRMDSFVFASPACVIE